MMLDVCVMKLWAQPIVGAADYRCIVLFFVSVAYCGAIPWSLRWLGWQVIRSCWKKRILKSWEKALCSRKKFFKKKFFNLVHAEIASSFAHCHGTMLFIRSIVHRSQFAWSGPRQPPIHQWRPWLCPKHRWACLPPDSSIGNCAFSLELIVHIAAVLPAAHTSGPTTSGLPASAMPSTPQPSNVCRRPTRTSRTTWPSRPKDGSCSWDALALPTPAASPAPCAAHRVYDTICQWLWYHRSLISYAYDI